MSATVTKLSSNKVKIDFVVDSERFERGIQAAYRKNVGRINIQGFRKGKAPRRVIEMQYGENVFYEDAIDDVFAEVYPQAVKDNDLNPVDRPSFELKEVGSGKDLEFSVEVFVKPDVKLGKYKGVEAEKHVSVISEDDVKAEIERARERASTYVDVTDRAAKLDDQVTINYAGFTEGDHQFEGGTAEDHKLVLGSGSFIPGFEEQLVGVEIGEEVDVNVTFPEEYHSEELKGKPAVFKVTITAIQEKEIPALDDEFAKDVSECETFEQYTEKIRADLQKRADDRDEADFENELLEIVAHAAEVDIPDAMIESRVDAQMRDMAMRLAYQGMNMEMYQQYTGQTEADLREQMRHGAEHEVMTQLVLEAIRNEEKIEAADEEVEAEIERYVERSRGDLEKFKESLTEDDRTYFADVAKTKKVIDLIKAEAVAPTGDKADKQEKEEE